MTATELWNMLVTEVRELRRMHTVYSRPWNVHQRKAVEACEKRIDEMIATYAPDAEAPLPPRPATESHL